MTFDNVKYNVVQGKYNAEGTVKKIYSQYHIFYEDMSVKWNKEEVIRRNREIFQYNKDVRKERDNTRTLFDTGLCKAAIQEYSESED